MVIGDEQILAGLIHLCPLNGTNLQYTRIPYGLTGYPFWWKVLFMFELNEITDDGWGG